MYIGVSPGCGTQFTEQEGYEMSFWTKSAYTRFMKLPLDLLKKERCFSRSFMPNKVTSGSVNKNEKKPENRIFV